MPNANPIIRSMDWGICLKILPDNISKHLPEGDPVKNKDNIERSLESMKQLGPKGKDIIDNFVNGDITHNEMIDQLDNLKSEINEEDLEKFRHNIQYIIDESNKSTIRCFIPFMSAGVNVETIKETSTEIQKLNIYEREKSENEIKMKN